MYNQEEVDRVVSQWGVLFLALKHPHIKGLLAGCSLEVEMSRRNRRFTNIYYLGDTLGDGEWLTSHTRQWVDTNPS